MSAPDARLSAAERAALADLEAAAAAADPRLAERLKGASESRVRTVLPALRRFQPEVLRLWVSFLRLGWWGVPLSAAGLALMVLGLSAGPAFCVLGAIVAVGGLRLVAEALEGHRHRPRSGAAG